MKKLLIFLSMFILVLIPIKVNALEDGIDVSVFQGEIDFERVKSDGIQIVYIRSSYGSSGVDSRFRENYENAKKNNLKIGFYHFLTARNVEEAREQARFFSYVIANTKPDCKLAIDFEVLRGLSKEEINEITEAFLETVTELTKKETIVYSDAYNAKYKFARSIADKYPLWIAQYDVNRPEVSTWDDWIGWQYTDKGKVYGINGNVDKDFFKNDIYLSDNKEIEEPDIKEEDKNKTIYYRVMPGNTLSQIAKEYHVSVDDLIEWNDIKNPNKIYPNQILKIKTDYRYIINNDTDEKKYIVRKNDTLSSIAYLNHVTVNDLILWNNIKNPNLIYSGQILYITHPPKRHLIKYKIVKNDTLYWIAKTYHTSINELTILNKIKNPNLIFPGEIIYISENF